MLGLNPPPPSPTLALQVGHPPPGTADKEGGGGEGGKWASVPAPPCRAIYLPPSPTGTAHPILVLSRGVWRCRLAALHFAALPNGARAVVRTALRASCRERDTRWGELSAEARGPGPTRPQRRTGYAPEELNVCAKHALHAAVEWIDGVPFHTFAVLGPMKRGGIEMAAVLGAPTRGGMKSATTDVHQKRKGGVHCNMP